MSKPLQELILAKLREKRQIRASEIVEATGFSRTYVNRAFQELQREGRVILLGKANRARYVTANKGTILHSRREELVFRQQFHNKDLSEDAVLAEIKLRTGILDSLPENVLHIVEYGFTEMLNNAIEHSRSKIIFLTMERDAGMIWFSIIDRGIGIFKNLMETRGLKNTFEAIQDLLKGKQTTDPSRHSGEGIFFTSKLADMLTIKGSNKKLIFDNRIGDLFIKDSRPLEGTEVIFQISLRSKKHLREIFSLFSDNAYEFGRTVVTVRLYKAKGGFISRSEARRILSGLESFKHVTLDFQGVESVGQAFADEVFRVWRTAHPDVRIEFSNAGENVQFMIKHVLGS